MKVQACRKSALLFWSVVFILLHVVAAQAKQRFEFIGNDEEIALGDLVSLDAEKLVLKHDGSEKSILRDRLEAIRNCSENPYFMKDSIQVTTKGKLTRNERKRSERNISLPRPQALAESVSNQSEAAAVLNWTFPESVCVLDLVDGSRLVATSLASEGQAVKAGLLLSPSQSKETATQKLPLALIRRIRFNVKSLENVLSPSESWQKLSSGNNGRGDQLVVGQGEKLDLYHGALVSLTDETISFSVDGETLPVPRRKIFGLLLHQPAANGSVCDKPAKPVHSGSLSLWNGAQIVFQSLETDEQGKVQWTSLAGVSGFSALEEIDQIIFGQSDMIFLSELPFRVLRQTLPFRWNKAIDASSPTHFFETFRTNRMASGGKPKPADALGFPITTSAKTSGDKRLSMLFNQPIPDLDGIYFDGAVNTKGMMVPLGTALEWTLPEPYGSLRGFVGFDDRFRPKGQARLQILSGSSLVYDQIIQGDEAVRQLEIDLPDDSRSLTVQIDFVDSLTDTIPLGIADFKLLK